MQVVRWQVGYLRNMYIPLKTVPRISLGEIKLAEQISVPSAFGFPLLTKFTINASLMNKQINQGTIKYGNLT